MKPCTKCKEEKPLSSFWKRKDSKDGYYQQCIVCVSVRTKLYRDKDRPKWRTINTDSWRNLRKLVLEAYGNKCACCGESRFEFLAIDHVNGGGTKHRHRVGTSGVYSDAKNRNFPNDYRLLCHNCNQSLGFVGYCPHERERECLQLEILNSDKPYKECKEILAVISDSL